jgi:rubredoxin
MEDRTMKFICTLCNYIIEEEIGLPAAGVEAGTSFEQLADDWLCPSCAGAKEFFQSCSCVSLPIFEATKVKKIIPLKQAV